MASGPEVLKHEYGALIDEHDVVLRLNNAPTVGYERHVGSFTSVRLTNTQYEGVREYNDEAVLAKWGGGFGALQRLGEKKTHALNPAFRWQAQTEAFFLAAHMSTSGFLGTLLLLHTCKEVSAFGFTGSKLEAWYYNKRPKGEIPKDAWLRNAHWKDDRTDFPVVKTRAQIMSEGTRELAAQPRTAGDRKARRAKELAIGASQKATATTGRRRLLEHDISVERRCMLDLHTAGLVSLYPPPLP